MKIGFDAKWFFEGPPSGRRIVRSLVNELAQRANDVELHVFLDARARDEPFPFTGSHVRPHYLWGDNNQLANVCLVPRMADRLGLDAVVYQNFSPLPLRVRHARIAFIHSVVFHERPEFFSWWERFYLAPMRALSSRADRVCTVSESERRRMIRLGYAEADRIDVVHNAVDAVFIPRAAISPGRVARVLGDLGVSEPFVLYVGRLTAGKNVGALIAAMTHIAHRDHTLVIAGAADRTCSGLPALAHSLGVSERVRFIGPQDDQHLDVLYAAASVFCFPSLDESFGLPPLEAMAAGTPTIVSDIPVFAEICGDAAVRVDPANPRAISAAIDAVLSDQALRERLRRAGLQHAAKFTWHRSANELLASVRTSLKCVA